MADQLNSFESGEFQEEIFIEKFDSTDIDNEKEDDILNIQNVDLSEIAVSGTDWTTETIISQIKKGNILLDPDFQRRDA